MKSFKLCVIYGISLLVAFSASPQASTVRPQEARSLAREAYIRVFNNYFPGKGGRFRVCGRERNGL